MNSNNYLVIGVVVVLIVLAIFFVTRGSSFLNSMQSPSPVASVLSQATVEPSPSAIEASSGATITDNKMIIPLAEQNKSGESGAVTLSEDKGKVIVALAMKGAPTNTPQPAHIHVGKCPTVGAVKYPLTNVVNGKSETVLNVDMKTLLSQLPLAINVHKSSAEVNTYVSCGDLIKAQ